jgi:tRNA pseudouridine13 synthase
LPSKKFAKKGNFLILRVKKQDLSSWEMVDIFADFLKIPSQKIGLAGLKDKHATTTQYVSFEAKYEDELRAFSHKDITILESLKDTTSLSMGELEANRFSVNLYGLTNIEAGKIEKTARAIAKNGLPNYFGYQRFGRDGASVKQSHELVDGSLHVKDGKLKSFLYSIYQSHYFNRWLAHRVKLSLEAESKTLIALEGDVVYGKVITGLLCGRGVKRATKKAREIESLYDDEFFQEKGLRREAVVFPKDIACNYKADKKCLNISFTMPKSSYATVFLESILGKNLSVKE